MVSVSGMKRYLRPIAGVLLFALFGSCWIVAEAQVMGIGEKVPGMINNEATITFEAKERPISDVLDHIRSLVGINILLAPGIEDTITLKLNDVPWRDALEIVAEKADCIVIEKSSKIYRVEKPPRVTFSFTDEDIKLVINAIAQSAGADVIIAPDVEGKVNMHVENIPWKDALENVVKTLGYHMVEENRGVLRIVTSASLIEQLEVQVFELKYIRPRNVYLPTIQSEYIVGEMQAAEGDMRKDFALLPAPESLLSKNGKLDYFPQENVVFVKDIKPVLDRIASIIERIDQEPLQVQINVQFVSIEKRDTFDASFGFAGTDGHGLEASWEFARKLTPFPFNTGRGGFSDTILPGATPDIDVNNFNADPSVIPGLLDFSLIQFLVQLIEVSSYTRIVQTPRIVTLDHHESTIMVGDSVRWAQVDASSSQSGTVEFSIKEASNSPIHVGFQLFVTPHIIPGSNKIVIAVIPNQNFLNGTSLEKEGFDKFEVGQGGDNVLFLPRVRSQTIVTNLILESGQLGVIGGLITSREQEILTKIPWLGDIPILGWLFKAKSTVNVEEELLVLITPEIIESSSAEIAKISKVLDGLEKMGVKEFEDIFGEDEGE